MSDDLPFDPKTVKIIIDPEALAEMEKELPPGEVQAFLDKITEMVRSGEVFENSEPVDLEQMAIEEPELYRKIMEQEKRILENEEENGTPYKGPVLH